MPAFEETAVCRAPAEEVWKLLHDPARFPEWWAGVDRVDMHDGGVTRYMEEWPDFAYPTRVSESREGDRVTFSCLLSDISHNWTLSPAEGGCRVAVRVEVPAAEAKRVEAAREEMRASIPRLVAAAERAAGLNPDL